MSDRVTRAQTAPPRDPSPRPRAIRSGAILLVLLASLVPASSAAELRPLARTLGLHLVVGFDGTAPPARLLASVARGRVAGVILFARNIRSPGQVRALTRRLQAARPHGDPPLLVAIDQEGGLVKRLPGPPGHSPAELGRIGDTGLARREGVATGRSLARVGVNVDLAPVVDVGRPASVMDRLGRSYSSDPATVSRLAGAFTAGLAAAGVQATAKHYPGLGLARGDEDAEINRIDAPIDTLRRIDEQPFADLARARIGLVMVSTARYPALDTRAALFSRRIATGELRQATGFSGVSITDDLDTAAAARLGSPGARALAATRAGLDLLLFAQSQDDGDRATRALADAALSGRVGRSELERAADRVLALRRRLPVPGDA
ncbi:MAG: beta-N-acetylhexosaminidase [Actinobacteria bacterium]|nr:beta-N-acetylhexosaminidase [Actinomycetota bacterium]